MHKRIAPFAVATLAAAISLEVNAAVTAVNDQAEVTAGRASIISLIGNDLLDDGNLSSTNIYYEFNNDNQYVNEAGEPEDPFEGGVDHFVIVNVCSDDLSHGNALFQNGNLVYVADEGATGDDSMLYELNEITTGGEGGFQFIDWDLGSARFTIVEADTNAPLVTGRNRLRTAAALTNLCDADRNDLSSALQARCDELNIIAEDDPGALQGIVAQITPDEVLSLRRLTSDVSRQHTDLVYRQLATRRRAESATDTVVSEQEVSVFNILGGNAGDGLSRWSGFASVQYNAAEFSGDDLEDPYDTDTTSLTVGTDYRLSQRWLLGLALAWSEQDVEYNDTAGTLDASLYNLIGYASYGFGRLNLDLQLSYLRADQDLERMIQYSGVDTRTHGNTDSTVINVSTQLDWNKAIGGFNLRPYARIDYLEASIDGFRETGGMGWAVEASDQDMAQWNSALGLDTSYAASFHWGVLVPGINLSANSQSSKDYKPVSFHFIDDNSHAGDFTLITEGEDTLFYQYEANLVALFAGGASAYISYQGTADFADTEHQQVSMGGRWEF